MNGFDAGYAGTPLRSFLPVQLSLLEELARFRPQRYRGRGRLSQVCFAVPPWWLLHFGCTYGSAL